MNTILLSRCVEYLAKHGFSYAGLEKDSGAEGIGENDMSMMNEKEDLVVLHELSDGVKVTFYPNIYGYDEPEIRNIVIYRDITDFPSWLDSIL